MITVQNGDTKTVSLKAMALIVISNGAGTAALSFDGDVVAAAHTGTKTYGPYTKPGKFKITATSGQVEYRTDTARNTKSDQVTLIGPSTSIDELNTQFPATNNTGKTALVGATAPYTQYHSNGVDWLKELTAKEGSLDDASRAASQSVRSIALPSRAAKVIQSPVFLAAGRSSIGRTPKSFVPLDPRVEATQYYVDVTNGNDANTGLSWAQAYKSIWKATTSGNTAAVPYVVNIAAGRYNRNNAFSNAGPTVIPSQSCVFRAIGGQVECYTGNDLTWTLDSGTTYSAARSNVKRVIDWVNADSNNGYLELTLAATLAACRATANSWYTDGTTLYVNRIDGAAVTNANTAALMITIDGIKSTSSGSMHLYGITQLGGANGALQLLNNVNGRFYAEDCEFSFSTNSTFADNVTSLDIGLVVMNRCVSRRGQKDGFNYHSNAGSIPKAIHFDCMGYANGTVTASTSNNGVTIHDAGLLIDFNGRYFSNYGGDFAHANAGTMAVGVCTQTFGSYGDIARGGVALPGTGFHAIDSAAIYKFDCVGSDQITSSGTITQG